MNKNEELERQYDAIMLAHRIEDSHVEFGKHLRTALQKAYEAGQVEALEWVLYEHYLTDADKEEIQEKVASLKAPLKNDL